MAWGMCVYMVCVLTIVVIGAIIWTARAAIQCDKVSWVFTALFTSLLPLIAGLAMTIQAARPF